MKPEDLTDLRRWAEAHPQSTQARQVIELLEELEITSDSHGEQETRIAELEALVLAQAERIAAQSELSKTEGEPKLKKPLAEFIQDLRAAGGDGWDAIDAPEEFLNGKGAQE